MFIVRQLQFIECKTHRCFGSWSSCCAHSTVNKLFVDFEEEHETNESDTSIELIAFYRVHRCARTTASFIFFLFRFCSPIFSTITRRHSSANVRNAESSNVRFLSTFITTIFYRAITDFVYVFLGAVACSKQETVFFFYSPWNQASNSSEDYVKMNQN